jgi:hypothetical protein
MSDPKKSEPDDDLLEFLGGIDEANDESRGEDFSDFLANADIEKVVEADPQPKTPPKPSGNEEKNHE